MTQFNDKLTSSTEELSFSEVVEQIFLAAQLIQEKGINLLQPYKSDEVSAILQIQEFERLITTIKSIKSRDPKLIMKISAGIDNQFGNSRLGAAMQVVLGLL